MHITRTSRDTYQFTADFFRPDGRVTFADFASARKFASQISAHRSQPVPASDLYAMSLIDEALRILVSHYAPPALMNSAVSHVDQSVGPEPVTTTEKKFVSEFPPENVYRGEEKVEEYLSKVIFWMFVLELKLAPNKSGFAKAKLCSIFFFGCG